MMCASAQAALPGGVARAFHDAGIPLTAVSVVVRESGQPQPLFSHDADRPMNPASVMKVVTTYAALELLGPEYRWKTEAYLAGKLDRKGTLAGNLVIKGYGDPKITIEQWQAFMAELRAQGLAAVTGDLVLDRSYFKLPEHDPAAFDQEPLRPYNVGPDALLVNFKAVRFAFAPDARRNALAVRADPPLPGDRRVRTAATRQRRMRRLARDRCRAIRRPRQQRGRDVSRPLSRRRAASATGTWRCSTIRTTCSACSRRTSASAADSSPEP